MRLSSKSVGDRVISRGQFTGGLNTTTVPEMIAENQLAECVNMEFNKSTGALQTCCGSIMIYKAPTGVELTDTFYDKINNEFLVIDTNKNVYRTHLVDMVGDGTDLEKIGTLNGDLSPMAVMWEYGLLIASGGRLQYYDGRYFKEIELDFSDERNLYEWTELGSSVTTAEWQADTDYSFDDIVYRTVDSETVYCRLNITSSNKSAFDETEWEVLTVNDEWKFETVYKKNEIIKDNDTYYICKVEHTSISQAPAECNGVFVKNGRVWVWHKYTLMSSGVGDERMWSDISSDDSSSKWIDVGYKEGEENTADIVGVTALSSDIIIIKADGKIYRLAGNYPDWNLIEVARNVDILNRNCYTAIQDGVFILSRNSLFYLQTTQTYGDIEPQNIAVNINNLFSDLSLEDTKMEFIPSLNQIWITSRGNSVIVFDVAFRAFVQREFSTRVRDLVTNYSAVLLVKADKVTRLMQGVFYDDMYSDDVKSIDWKFTAKTDTDFYSYLLKRVRIAYVPFSEEFTEANVIMAKGKIEIPIPEEKKVTPPIVDITTNIVDDDEFIFPYETQFNTKWMVYRDRSFDMKAKGINAPLMINKIDSDLVEVG